jgi:hypothetical protein
VAEAVVSVMFDTAADPQLEWLYHVGPVGLVIGPNIIREEDLNPPRQSAVETESVKELLNTEPDGPALAEPWEFFQRILGWEARYVAGAPGGPDLPHDLATRVDEHDLVLSPDWAVRDLGRTDPAAFQILVKLHTDLDANKRGSLKGWEASPHQQFERLLRDTGVAIGALVDRTHLRLIYAPKGETSGWLSFPLRSLGTVAGRAMLAGLKLMLGHPACSPSPRRGACRSSSRARARRRTRCRPNSPSRCSAPSTSYCAPSTPPIRNAPRRLPRRARTISTRACSPP